MSTSTKSRNILLGVLLALSIIGNGVLFYLWYQDHYADGKSIKLQNEELAELLESANIRADSLQVKLDATLSDYQSLINESILLQEEKEEINTELEEKKIQIRTLIYRANQGDPKALLAAKNKIDQLKKELQDKEADLVQQKKVSETYMAKVNEAEYEVNQVTYEKEKIEDEHDALKDKVKNTKFQISELTVEPIRMKRGKELLTEKASKIEFVRISFLLEANDLIDEGPKEIALRFLGTNGEVLGADNDEVLMDSDKLVSMKQEINYDGESKKIKLKYSQEAAYKKGSHMIEIVGDGKVLTRTGLILE